jgi:hypothetical protein
MFENSNETMMIKNFCNKFASTELALVDSESTNSHMITDTHFDNIDYNRTMSTEVAKKIYWKAFEHLFHSRL